MTDLSKPIENWIFKNFPILEYTSELSKKAVLMDVDTGAMTQVSGFLYSYFDSI